jgi:uncharacterized membrane protein
VTSIRFDHPELLWLIPVIALLVVWIARRSLSGMGPVKRWVVLVVRLLVVAAIVGTMARPKWAEQSEDLTVIVVADHSHSVPAAQLAQASDAVRTALEAKPESDRIGVVAVGEQAWITAMPDPLAPFDPYAPDAEALDQTNLAAGTRLAMAIAPSDTAARILLISDGLETADSVRDVAELCQANGIPIDVLPVEYDHPAEVVFESLVAPAQARPGQAVVVKMVLRATAATSGRIGLIRGDDPIDLNGSDPGTELVVQLRPGANTFPRPVDVTATGIYNWRAYFVSDEGAYVEYEPGGAFLATDDGESPDNPNNNRAEAVTFVHGEGTVLVLDTTGGTESERLVEALRASRINVEVREPQNAFRTVVDLTQFDAVILVNVPRYGSFSYAQEEALLAYVEETPGGLIFVGGPNSFGAGGWIGSPLAEAIPLKLDPPQTRQIPRGALVMIMHSTEMPQGNFWAEQCAIAAVDGLTAQDLVGVIDYNWQGGDTWEYPLSLVGDRYAVKQAIRSMPVGDMPDFNSSLSLALDKLAPAEAGQKAVIIMSDGDANPPAPSTLQRAIDRKVVITTLMIAGHGGASDVRKMKNIALSTGGEFHHIRNPKKLPSLFQKVAIETQRSLIVEGEEFQLTSHLSAGPTAGIRGGLPPISGYVLATDRGGKSDVAITSEKGDPLFASWQYGLGKVVACTFDANPTRWGHQWVPWDQFEAFWERTVRWAMRPVFPPNVTITTEQNGDRVGIELRILDEEGGFANDEQLRCNVIGPDNVGRPVRLSQIGPGRYAGEFTVSEAGAYLVNVQTGAGGTSSAVQGGAVQAAVSVPFSREFAAIRSDNALLRDVAEMTGGRYLDAWDPATTVLFDRTGLVFPETLTEIWPLFAIIAAGLFVLDVAARRVAIDVLAIVANLRGGMRRREESTTGAMEALKRTRAQAGERLDSSGRRRAEQDQTEHVDRTTKFEASGPVDTSILEDDSVRPAEERPHKRAAPRPERDETDGDEEGYTSRLLSAKRRAANRGDENERAEEEDG